MSSRHRPSFADKNFFAPTALHNPRLDLLQRIINAGFEGFPINMADRYDREHLLTANLISRHIVNGRAIFRATEHGKVWLLKQA